MAFKPRAIAAAHCKAWAAAAAWALASLLGGCSTEPLVLRYDTNGSDGRVWPAPQTQEVPRYRYVGQLTGEGNFTRAEAGNGGTFKRALRWLVGLSDREPNPLVLQRPQSGTVDAQGRVLVTDVSRAAVFVFDEAAGRLDVWERASASQRFVAPIGVIAGRDGEVLVSDAELHVVVRLDAQGQPVGTLGEGLLKRPTGLARDARSGRVFVADTYEHDVKVFDDDGRLIDRWGHRGDAAGDLNFPTHLAWSNDRLFVTDAINARVQVFDGVGQPLHQLGQRGLYVGNLVRPKGVASDDEGNVYVVESMHDTLLVFDLQGRLLLSIGGTGSDVGKFYLPAGVWVDARNRIYVADMFNGRIVVFQFLGGG
jgi:DNA-binding beta-propeller fold protein YncE